MALLDKIKVILRASNTAYDESEIIPLIEEVKADLGIAGIVPEKIIDTDPLIFKAVRVYVKANFGWDNSESEKLMESYESVKTQLSLSTNYSFFAVTFNVVDSATAEPIRMAEVIFDNETKTTDANGQAVFHVRKGSNYKYSVTASGYEPDADVGNLLDVSASQAIAISLVVI